MLPIDQMHLVSFCKATEVLQHNAPQVLFAYNQGCFMQQLFDHKRAWKLARVINIFKSEEQSHRRSQKHRGETLELLLKPAVRTRSSGRKRHEEIRQFSGFPKCC